MESGPDYAGPSVATGLRYTVGNVVGRRGCFSEASIVHGARDVRQRNKGRINMQKVTIHLISNAHLDPVWLWDWREGLNESMATCRAVLNLMDEVPELTFIRGEAVIYQHLERHDPQTFDRIRKYVAQGRWDVVGGTWLQPDTNMPATETFARHFCHGQRYFREKFGKPVRVAWAADSFGHSAGLKESGSVMERPRQDRPAAVLGQTGLTQAEKVAIDVQRRTRWALAQAAVWTDRI